MTIIRYKGITTLEKSIINCPYNPFGGINMLDVRILEGFDPPQDIVEYAKSISHQNFTINTPREFQKHAGNDVEFKNNLSVYMKCIPEEIDYVFFSCPQGAKPHKDELNLVEFEEFTYLMPLILPEGKVLLKVNETSVDISCLPVGSLIKFNHQHTHSLVLENSGECVLIMATKLKN